jgi:hypothetical protein
MQKNYLLLLLILFIKTANAQVIDDFSDGNFSLNPTWFGDDSLWQVNANFQLQSKGTSGTSKDICLATNCSIEKNTEWQFHIRFNFSPSTQNFCRYYLTSDQANLKGSLNGYYVQLGGSTGNTDTISLYKQIGLQRIKIIDGRPATVTKTQNAVAIKVTRDSAGTWTLYSDTTANTNFVKEGSALDSTFKTSLFSGIYAKFTSTNIANFYLDNVYIGQPILDQTPPQILSFELKNDSIIVVYFSEKITESETQNLLNFELNTSFPTITQSTLGADGKSIQLLFSNRFVQATNYQVFIKNMHDFSGNKMNDTSFQFVFYKPMVSDVVINEILPDPTPTNGIPEAEFIELYNRSNFDINIGGWKIYDLTGFAVIPNYVLKAKQFLIITNSTNENLFKKYGNTLGISNLPSLNNDGDLVKLTDKNETTIDEIRYDLSWYPNTLKKDGGWSLELINPYTLCKGIDNWMASESSEGGTPGKTNFFSSTQPDTISPIIKKLQYIDNHNIIIIFNEKLDEKLVQNIQVKLANNLVSKLILKGNKYDTLEITLANPMLPNQNYSISVDSIFDCSGNKIADNTQVNFVFIPIKMAQQNDIIITEVSANPLPNTPLPDAEYIELYNRSKYIISLKNFTLKKGTNTAVIGNYWLYPDSFLVICDDSKLSAFLNNSNVLDVKNFPTLSADDELIILDSNNHIIHQLAYYKTWYNNNIKAIGGWSLEMIDPKNPCGTASNWTASKSANGGTIGYKNSVSGTNKDNTKPELLRVYPSHANELVLYFSETLDSMSVCKKENFNITPTIAGNYKLKFNDLYLTKLAIQFSDSIKLNTIYQIKIDSAKDCAQNELELKHGLEFALLQPADSNNMVINEILFNPKPNGVDFVEIYNKSNQYIDLKNVLVGSRKAGGLIENFYEIAPEGYMVLPNQYYAITTSSQILTEHCEVPNKNNIITLKSMPSFNDDEGNCVLFTKNETIIDELNYTEKMHFALIDNKEGVSLERINYNAPTANKNNWTSAAGTSNFSTPTYKNSQFLNQNQGAQLFNINPEVFTPNNDGVNDLVTFSFNVNNNNYLGSLHVFNSNGVLVKTLLNNAPLAPETVINWNGLGNKNELLPVGIYIVYFECLNTDGNMITNKKTLVIGKTF